MQLFDLKEERNTAKKLCSLCNNCYVDLLDTISIPNIIWD